MKANELMIGDWVMSTHPAVPRPIRVKEIYDRNVGYKNGVLHMAFIEPIPLTPEILEKNGFTKELDAGGLHYWFTLIDGHTRFLIHYARSVFHWFIPLDFKYVHELQHALKLCGIKKEIEL